MKEFRSGFVTILGRPNVGKSTLLNALIKDKVSIISPIPQTTRHQIKGILNLSQAQIIFVDTPGIHSFKDKLSSHLNSVAQKAISGCDLIIYVVDVLRSCGQEELKLIKILSRQKTKIIIALNKIDLGMKFFNDYIDLCRQNLEKKSKNESLVYYIPVSAKTQKNIDRLQEAILENLPAAQPYYDKEAITDFPLKFRIADLVREKLFLSLKKELPHSLAVEVSEVNEQKRPIYIKVNIYVRRNSQKMIVVGKRGQMLKSIGKAARQEIEGIYKQKVFLDIWVTVLKDWQEKPRILKELGYW